MLTRESAVPTIRFMQEDRFPRQAAALQEFAERTGVDVSIDLLPPESIWSEARRAFGEPPLWDLLVADEIVVAEAIHNGVLEPLGRRAHRDGLDLDDFLQAGIDRFRASDVVYAIPYLANSNVLVYRSDILDRYSFAVPTTWDELRETAIAAQYALRADGIYDVCGFVSRGVAGYGHNFWIIGSSVLPAWGWQWNRGSGEPPAVYTPEAIAAIDFYAALLRDAGPPDSANLTVADSHRAFAEGKAVFLVDTATGYATTRKDAHGGLGDHAAIAMIPTGPTGRPEPGLGSPAFCIPASSPRKDEAWQLLRLLVTQEHLLDDASTGGLAEPARDSVFNAPEYAAAYDMEFRAVLRRTRSYARINRPLIPYGYELGNIIGAAAAAVIAGDDTATGALSAAQSLIDSMDWRLDRSAIPN